VIIFLDKNEFEKRVRGARFNEEDERESLLLTNRGCSRYCVHQNTNEDSYAIVELDKKILAFIVSDCDTIKFFTTEELNSKNYFRFIRLIKNSLGTCKHQVNVSKNHKQAIRFLKIIGMEIEHEKEKSWSYVWVVEQRQ